MERYKKAKKLPASDLLSESNMTEEELKILDEFNHPPGKNEFLFFNSRNGT